MTYTTYPEAAGLTVTCTANDCVVASDNTALFHETNIKPLDSFHRTLTVTNSQDTALDFTFHVKDSTFIDPNTPNLGGVMLISITNENTGKIIISQVPLESLKGQSIALGSIPAHSSTAYTVTASMQDVGNEYQQAIVVFDLDFTITATTTQAEPSVLAESISRVLGAFNLPETGIQGVGYSSIFLVAAMCLITVGLFLRYIAKKLRHS